MQTSRTIVWVIVALVVGGQAALAAAPCVGDFRTRATGDWDNNATWEQWDGTQWDNTPAFPDWTDVATIRGVHTVTVAGTTEAVKTLIMEDTFLPAKLILKTYQASLTIRHALEMENNGSPESTISFDPSGASGAGPSLIANADITIAGLVEVVTGTGTGSRITSAAPGDVVTVSSTGRLTATSADLAITSADVVMDGTVNPGANRTISFSGGINGGSSGKWELTNSGSTIKINTTAAVDIVSSAGHIKIANGTLDLDQDFTFAGGLKQTGGTIDVATSKTFTVNGRYFD